MTFDFERLLALNNGHATELSWLEPRRLAVLVERAFFVRSLGSSEAFLLAFDQDADYDSPNFLWFRARYDRFVYIGRIVCEVNSDPPNPASAAFHASLGFREVGAALLPGGAKTVRYLERTL